MGCELDELMWAAWERIEKKVMAEPGELARRIARRRSRMFELIPKSLCLGVRAGDLRITPMRAAICPEDALERKCEHEVVLDRDLVVDLCRPVQIEWPDEEVDRVAERMGCHQQGLTSLRRSGFVRTRYVKGLGGKRGKPVPLIYIEVPLDPCSQGKEPPCPLMMAVWRERSVWLSWEMPAQTVVRRPVACGPHRATWSRWKWVCPGCGKLVDILYYPVGSSDWAGAHGLHIRVPEWDQIPRPMGCFACRHCHNVKGFSRADEKALRMSWAHIILHLSGGLLYGHEVERPGWLTVVRKKRFARRRAQEATGLEGE